MPLLWTPIWITPPDFRVWRGKLSLFIVGWQPGIYIQVGNPLIIRETPFGGFRFHVKLNPDFWTPNSKEWRLADLFEDVYVTFPGSTVPYNAGAVNVRVGGANPEYKLALVLDMPAGVPTYYFTATPELPLSYWARDNIPWVNTPPYIYTP